MAYKGKRISNPVNKQTIEFITTSKDSNGRELEMVATWKPNSLKPAPHYHPYQDEVFKIMKGELTILLQGRTYLLKEGEIIHIPATTVHSMWNEGSEEVVVNWKVSPAYDTEYLLETGVGLAADGKTGKNGLPGILQVALLAKKFRKEFRLHKPSYILQKIVFGMLAPLALLSGKKAVYPEYID
ncbi:MAG TPA: cupin domain-containing protein [Flavisolibacter sp.]